MSSKFKDTLMRTNSKVYEDRIIKCLTKERDGLSLTQIARSCDMSITTATKYAWILEARGAIELRDYGRTYVARLKRR